MKGGRVSPAVAVALIVVAVVLVLWQFVFRSNRAVSGPSASDLPASMKVDPNAPPLQISGPIPHRPTRPGTSEAGKAAPNRP
ncbi:MAG TPA: hypothetical protein VFB21_00440 [Chthonomonadaceae bacterium]|nr:hypothetical protein [Chthonomonadaceae bacterium]